MASCRLWQVVGIRRFSAAASLAQAEAASQPALHAVSTGSLHCSALLTVDARLRRAQPPAQRIASRMHHARGETLLHHNCTTPR